MKYRTFIQVFILIFLLLTARITFACETQDQINSDINSLQQKITQATVDLQSAQSDLNAKITEITTNSDTDETNALTAFEATSIGKHKPDPSDYPNNPSTANPQYIKDIELYNGALHNATAQIEQNKEDALQQANDSGNSIIQSKESIINGINSQISDLRSSTPCAIPVPLSSTVTSVIVPQVIIPPLIINQTPQVMPTKTTPVKKTTVIKRLPKVTIPPVATITVTPSPVIPSTIDIMEVVPPQNWFQRLFTNIKNLF